MQAAAPQELETDIPVPSGWGFAEGDDITEGRYALQRLGGGRRYEAYLAQDENLLSLVVVKILRPDRVADEGAARGLRQEFHALQDLNHPSIARAFDGVLEGDRPHIVLEFLDGPRLSTLIRKYGHLPLEQSIPLAVQLCSALHYMHGRRMVHLDIKPSNIIMAAPPRLIDLSIARSFEDASALKVAVGTDAYMAPEQCLVPSGSPVGPAADIWGLGVTLYEAVAGRLPWPKEEDDPHPQTHMEPEPLDEKVVPPAIAALVSRCLQHDPAARPTARELAEALEPLVVLLPRRPVLNRLRPRLK